MKAIAVVMAGGRGLRLALREEKPIIKCANKAMIDHVLDALSNCSHISETLVATSPYTPKTEKHVKSLGFRTIRTQGIDYVSDVKNTVKSVGRGIVLVIGADLPLITSRVIEEVVRHFARSKKSTMSVYYKTKTCAIPIGLNLFRAEQMTEGQLDEEVFESSDESLGVNVNTVNDLKKAETILGVGRRPPKRWRK